MGDFSNDLIFEIVKRMPLKEASRFKALNKTLYSHVSDHIQHKHFVESNHKVGSVLFPIRTMDDRNYLCQLQVDKPEYPLKYIDIDQGQRRKRGCEIIASCGGLVLIYSIFHKNYCVFNPITTEFQLVPSNVAKKSVGLAVDSIREGGQNSYRYRFRLVGFTSWQEDGYYSENRMFKFTTFGLDSTQCWKETDPQEFPIYSVGPGSEPVYLHGCMHWLLRGSKILAFDLGKGTASIIEGPGDYGDGERLEGVQDSLVFCICLESCDYLIYSYDHTYTKAWQLRHKIEKKGCLYNRLLTTFEGEIRMLLDLTLVSDLDTHIFEETHIIEEICVYDTWTKQSKKLGRMPDDIIYYGNGRLVPFVPTLAKLYSGLYFNCQVSREKLPEDIRFYVDVLYQTFSPKGNITVNHKDIYQKFELNLLFEDESQGAPESDVADEAKF